MGGKGKDGKDKDGKDKDGKRKGRDKHEGKHAPPLGRDGAVPTVGAHALGSMIQINDYADATRTSLIEVIDADGRPRTVVAPVTAVRAVAEPEPTVAPEVPVAVATEVAGLTAIAAQAASAIPDDQFLVRRQVADALQDVAAALAKLADSLDPR
ncbi:hypothetical protein [Gordonia caeni]|uniref:hypothetical protein n=1 Tax=Gordonia caeni TaxID=1007097 RepID=UPI0031CE0F96